MEIPDKRDIGVIRESLAPEIIHLLAMRGALVSYSDPHMPELRVNGPLSVDMADGAEEGTLAIAYTLPVTNPGAFDYGGSSTVES